MSLPFGTHLFEAISLLKLWVPHPTGHFFHQTIIGVLIGMRGWGISWHLRAFLGLTWLIDI